MITRWTSGFERIEAAAEPTTHSSPTRDRYHMAGDLDHALVELARLLLKLWFVLVDVVMRRRPGGAEAHYDAALASLVKGATKPLAGGLGAITTRTSLDVVVKRNNAGAVGRFQCYASRSHREARFYEEERFARRKTGERTRPALLSDEFAATQLPEVLYVHSSPMLGEYCVVMRHVAPGESARVYLGNQCDIWGPLPPGTFENRAFPHLDRIGMMREMFLAAARIHASTWNDPRVYDRTRYWLKNAETYARARATRGRGRGGSSVASLASSTARDEWEQALEYAREAWKLARAFRPPLANRRFERVIETCLRESSYDSFVTHIAREETTFSFIHGDFHAGNTVLGRRGGEEARGNEKKPGAVAVMVDWSECGVGEPACDLGQTLISDFPAEELRRCGGANFVRGLVKEYCDEVSRVRGETRRESSGGPNPEETFRAALRAGLEKWLFLYAVMNGMEVIPNAAMAYFERNIVNWLEMCEEARVFDDEFSSLREGEGEDAVPIVRLKTVVFFRRF